ncbi:MAG: bifunctional phosphopantothenoylcysteine decarboxylase/phosphopantothenate--cysteine ligase CoaBC [Blastocatellia bacterium]|jgi:phosphopantothenoylcysteine decarboxylase/phosphopantothenate--cysteine ligase
MRVLLGITGCIGAYKAAEVLRRLQDAGVVVRVVMTRHATEFVRPLTFEALSGQPVIVGMYERPDYATIEHIALARQSDLLLVAPATAGTIAKFAQGLADDFLSTLYLSNTNPVLIAPAMNVEMWNHPATRSNIEILRQRGVHFVDPGVGYQACGEVGAGRLAVPEEIVRRTLGLLRPLRSEAQDLVGRHVLITAGPTVEDLDPVRYLTNRSSGRMGYALAEAARERGARVTLVTGPVQLAPPNGVELDQVRSSREMYDAVLRRLEPGTIFIGAAAVADFRPVRRADQKIKKNGQSRLTIELEPTEDIIGTVATAAGREARVIVGFAAESQSVIGYAERKRREKSLDLIVANDITLPGAGFDTTTNAATIIRRDGHQIELPLQEKREMADRILDEVVRILTEE